MDLKYYTEFDSKGLKKLKNSGNNKDTHFDEKYEVFKILESEFSIKKIYYNKGLESFFIIFNGGDEKDVYLSLARIKEGYKNLQFYLDIEYNKYEYTFDYNLEINYDFITQKLISNI